MSWAGEPQVHSGRTGTAGAVRISPCRQFWRQQPWQSNWNPRLTRQTLGIAGSNTPLPSMWLGSKSLDLPDSKYQEAGWAALTGVFAARSAALGATGLSAIFDGDRGLIKTCGTNPFDPDALVDDFGSRWMLADITYKPWPTCRWMHQALTALVKAATKGKIEPQQIERVITVQACWYLPPGLPILHRAHGFLGNTAVRTLRRWGCLAIPLGPAWLDKATGDNQNVRELREKVCVESWDRTTKATLCASSCAICPHAPRS